MDSVACRLRKHLLRCLSVAAGLIPCVLAAPADAQIGSSSYSSIIVEASSGDVLEDVNADQLRHPASLTKMIRQFRFHLMPRACNPLSLVCCPEPA